MNTSKKTELKDLQRDLELLSKRQDAILETIETICRVEGNQLAERINNDRHQIKSHLNHALNALVLIETGDRVKEGTING